MFVEGDVSVAYDDSILQDTEAVKRRNMSEVEAGLMQAWEYRAKWRGEDEATTRRNAAASDPTPHAPAGRGRPQATT